MPVVRAYTKYKQERLRLYVDYSCWLEDDEQLTDFQITVAPYTTDEPLWLDTSYPDGDHKKLMFFAAGGKANTDYTLTMLITTDEGQVKRDDIRLRVMP